LLRGGQIGSSGGLEAGRRGLAWEEGRRCGVSAKKNAQKKKLAPGGGTHFFSGGKFFPGGDFFSGAGFGRRPFLR